MAFFINNKEKFFRGNCSDMKNFRKKCKQKNFRS